MIYIINSNCWDYGVILKTVVTNVVNNEYYITFNYFRQIWSQTYQDLTIFCVEIFGHSRRQ